MCIRDSHNAVFVGFDTDGVPRHAHKRGTGSQSSYKGNIGGSLPEYIFHWLGRSERLCLFEAPIDMLSFISLHKGKWQSHSYAACCGVSDAGMWRMFKDNTVSYTHLLALGYRRRYSEAH